MSIRNQISIKDDSELLSEDAQDPSSDLTPRKRNTTAIYSDQLRHLIIQEIAKRPSLWDTKSREPLSLVSRKKSFAEIAENLSTDDVPLQAADIEKQWKNLKDTYYKVKKKYVEAVASNPTETVPAPKWRFYSALLFIDSIEENDQPAEPVEEEQPSQHRTRKRKSTPGTSSKNAEAREAKKIAAVKAQSEIPEIKPKLESPPKVPSTDSVYVMEEEDDYASFCRYLNGKFREIGSINRTEFLKVQKQINDIIFETQIRLTETNGCNSTTTNGNNNH
uniref:MADF domain-containing protein n=1 Tax=Panagrolaimus sp. ES5 TaxID=591445 RepID=A0AC34GSU5_9BILA